jgi:hypothetical protein
VWLFAGGGEAEVRGLIPFLQKNFVCAFERKMPARRKPGAKPGHGLTGKGLTRPIKRQLRAALARGEACDLVLIIDDLDCRDADKQERRLLKAVEDVPAAAGVKKFVGFAAPELEAWLIADWDGTFAKDVDFRKNHAGIRWWLSREKGVPFDTPETFSVYDPARDTCEEKLSDAIIASVREKGTRPYSKATHTPRLLQMVDPEIVAKKCPHFKKLHVYLSEFCAQ